MEFVTLLELLEQSSVSLELLGEDFCRLLHGFQKALLCFLLPYMNQLEGWICPLGIVELAELCFFPIRHSFSMLDPSHYNLHLRSVPPMHDLFEHSWR